MEISLTCWIRGGKRIAVDVRMAESCKDRNRSWRKQYFAVNFISWDSVGTEENSQAYKGTGEYGQKAGDGTLAYCMLA